MSIRKYLPSDYNRILEIYSNSKLDELKFESAKFHLLPLDKDKIRSAQLFESNIYVYELGEVVGFCAYKSSEIRALFVHSSARGNGIGTKLLEFMLSSIADSVVLYVAASNHPAIKLYQKYGFQITSEFKTTYNDVAVRANKMEKPK